MNGINIYQIYYDAPTRASLDAGFIPFDNRRNERPDWYEYHPIRNFLLKNELAEDSFYGFFSPKFGQKTGLSSSEVFSFIARNNSCEVILFSPFLDQSAVFLSIFEQGEIHHSGLTDALQKIANAAKINVDIKRLITDSSNTVFCNYFVAKPSFWRRWLQVGEELYAIAESSSQESSVFREIVPYAGKTPVQLKVFVAERLASLILSTRPTRKIANYDPTRLPLSKAQFSQFRKEVIMLDALKRAFRATGLPCYMQAFLETRNPILKSVSESQKASRSKGQGSRVAEGDTA